MWAPIIPLAGFHETVGGSVRCKRTRMARPRPWRSPQRHQWLRNNTSLKTPENPDTDCHMEFAPGPLSFGYCRRGQAAGSPQRSIQTQAHADLYRRHAAEEAISSVALSPDALRAVIVSGATAQMWDVQAGRAGVSVRGQTGFNHVAFSPDGRRLLTASGDREVMVHTTSEARVWDAASGQPVTPPARQDAAGNPRHGEPLCP
jgi:WD40 repeat protein